MMMGRKWQRSAGGILVPSGALTDGLIAHYTMDNISGPTLVDEMGNYDAALVGSPAQVAGAIGQSLNFPNGDGNYFDTGISSWAPPGLAISQWLYFDAVSTTTGIYPSIHSSRGATQNVGIFTYQVSAIDSATGNRSIRPHINTSSGLISLDTDYIPSPGSWIHLAITYDGLLRAYINGLEDSNSGVAGGSILGTTNSLWFAECRSEEGFDGKMDHIRIYERALSAAECLMLYNEV